MERRIHTGHDRTSPYSDSLRPRIDFSFEKHLVSRMIRMRGQSGGR